MYEFMYEDAVGKTQWKPNVFPSFNMWWSVGSDLHFSESLAPHFPSFASL